MNLLFGVCGIVPLKTMKEINKGGTADFSPLREYHLFSLKGDLKMKYEQAIYFFLVLFLIVFCVDYFLITRRKLKIITNKGNGKNGKKKKAKSIGELDYLIAKFKLNDKKVNKERSIIWISLINSFIISFVSTVITLIPFKLIWQMLLAFALLFSLIYALYEIYGRHLKKEEEKNK